MIGSHAENFFLGGREREEEEEEDRWVRKEAKESF